MRNSCIFTGRKYNFSAQKNREHKGTQGLVDLRQHDTYKITCYIISKIYLHKQILQHNHFQ